MNMEVEKKKKDKNKKDKQSPSQEIECYFLFLEDIIEKKYEYIFNIEDKASDYYIDLRALLKTKKLTNDEKEVNRFNPCNFLAEFLMRNNPKYGKNKETHEKFLRYTRKERKTRMMKTGEDIMFKKVTQIFNSKNTKFNKLNIEKFVKSLDEELGLKNSLITWEWLEYFRVYKDNQTISLEEFLKAFKKAVLDIHEIDEKTLKELLSE